MNRAGVDTNVVTSIRNLGVCYRTSNRLWHKKSYCALRDVSFELLKAETLGVVGRNGVGKSSLLRALAGIIAPDCGSIERFGHSVAFLGMFLGFKQQLSGRDNAINNGLLLGMRLKDIKRQLDEIQEFSELGEFFDHPVRTYSAGMKARLRFAVAMQADPDILLIDELLGVGDASFRKKSAGVIRNRIDDEKTVVVVSHNVTTLRDLCDRLLWLDDGVTRMVGPTEEILCRYVAETGT